jgi:hypothetical protein
MSYLVGMFKKFEFCIPTRSVKVPTESDWLHEINTTVTGSASNGLAIACD